VRVNWNANVNARCFDGGDWRRRENASANTASVRGRKIGIESASGSGKKNATANENATESAGKKNAPLPSGRDQRGREPESDLLRQKGGYQQFSVLPSVRDLCILTLVFIVYYMLLTVR